MGGDSTPAARMGVKTRPTVMAMASMVAVSDLPAAIATWTALLGIAPTFVDGDRWAQFDIGGARVALAGTDRASEGSGVMLKVDDVARFRARALENGIAAGKILDGPHERRCVLDGPGDCAIVIYEPKP